MLIKFWNLHVSCSSFVIFLLSYNVGCFCIFIYSVLTTRYFSILIFSIDLSRIRGKLKSILLVRPVLRFLKSTSWLRCSYISSDHSCWFFLTTVSKTAILLGLKQTMSPITIPDILYLERIKRDQSANGTPRTCRTGKEKKKCGRKVPAELISFAS